MIVSIFMMVIGQLGVSEPLTSRRSVAVNPPHSPLDLFQYGVCRLKKTLERAMQSREWRIRRSMTAKTLYIAIGLGGRKLNN